MNELDSEKNEIEETNSVMKFMIDVAERSGYDLFEIRCGVEEVPQRLKDLVTAGARVMVGSVGTKEQSWTTKAINKRGLAISYKGPASKEETSKSSCVPVALRNLGFDVSQLELEEVAKSYDSTTTPDQKHHGHVMSVELADGVFQLSDQWGVAVVDSDTIIKLAGFRKSVDPTMNQGYFFLPKTIDRNA